jgi:hypothetical protein
LEFSNFNVERCGVAESKEIVPSDAAIAHGGAALPPASGDIYIGARPPPM